MVAKPKDDESPQQWFGAIVRKLVAGQSSFKLPEIAKEALAIARKDRVRYRAWLTASEYREAYGQVREVVRESRTVTGLRIVGDAAFTPEGAADAFSGRFSGFWNWAEHAGDRHVELPEMTREDLLVAADERQARGDHELTMAKFLRTIANGLEGGQIVSERFSEADVKSIYDQIMEGK